MSSPIWLHPENFTPLSRTPWAGSKIAKNYKELTSKNGTDTLIGESWEISCDPTFPSKTFDDSCDLQELITRHPKEMLGPLKEIGTCEILAKIINADDPLSFQIHPADNDPNLKANECGKPESWYILDAEPGSGIYLGFNKEITAEKFQTLISNDDPTLKEILQFIPVQPGDYFELSPGVPHAIGKGVTLFEPQRIIKGKTGKTFRIFDWNRRYNEDGKPSSDGKPRELHINQGTRLINFAEAHGSSYVEAIRRYPEFSEKNDDYEIQSFPDNSYYQLTTLKIKKKTQLNLDHKSFLLMTILSGQAKVEDQPERGKGFSAFIPAGVKIKDWNFQAGSEITLLAPSNFPVRICQKF